MLATEKKEGLIQVSPESKKLLRATASTNKTEAMAAMKAFATEITGPLKQAVFAPNTLTVEGVDIYQKIDVSDTDNLRFPLDIVAPGTEDDYVAFTMPKQGRVPERHVEGDELYIQTYKIANAIDWDLDFARDARWDVVARAMDVFQAGFTKRINDDGWHVILASANSAGYLIKDSAATAGFFTPALVYRMKTNQRRRVRNGDMTHIFVSSEALEDIRNWTTTQVSDWVRRDLFYAPSDGGNTLQPARPAVVSLNGVQICELKELGEGNGVTAEEYQQYWVSTLSGSFTSSKVELVIGLDLSKKDSFIMPIKTPLEVFETGEQLHRQGRAGVYGWTRLGMSAVDNRRCILGEF
jgi:hypothetical protein